MKDFEKTTLYDKDLITTSSDRTTLSDNDHKAKILDLLKDELETAEILLEAAKGLESGLIRITYEEVTKVLTRIIKQVEQ